MISYKLYNASGQHIATVRATNKQDAIASTPGAVSAVNMMDRTSVRYSEGE